MVLDWREKSKKDSVQALIARKSYTKAIELIRGALQKRRSDERLRIQLADVLVIAGRSKEAIEVLNDLADDMALGGQAAKAIAALKRIQKIAPGRPEVDEKLAYLITQQERPSPDPWKVAKARVKVEEELPPPADLVEHEHEPAFGMEEISDEPVLGTEADAAMAAFEPPAPPPAAAPASPPAAAPAAPPAAAPASPPAAARAAPPAPKKQVATTAKAAAPPPKPPAQPPPDQPAATAPETPAPEGLSLSDELHDELVSLVENVFRPVAVEKSESPGASGSDPIVETPLFKDFSREELVAVIRGLELLNFEPGEIVVSAGEPGDSMYIVASGLVRAFMRTAEGRHVQLRLMTDGDFFGEMSVLTGNPRTATVTAVTNCDLLQLDKPSLESIETAHPRVRDVLQKYYTQRAMHTAKTAREAARGK